MQQRQIAAESLRRAEIVNRYVRSVYAPKAGEVVKDGNGRAYEVQGDGSLVRKEGAS